MIKYTTQPMKIEDIQYRQTSLDLPPDTNIVRPGYDFGGWYKTFPGWDATPMKITSSTNWNWKRDITAQAKWNPKDCTIRWNGNGGKWGSVLEKSTTTNCGHVLADITWFNNPP